MLLLHPAGRSERVILGQDLLGGQHVQYVVTAGTWMGAQLVDGGRFALMGTTMAPGYDDQDFEGGSAAEFGKQIPKSIRTNSAAYSLIDALVERSGRGSDPLGGSAD